MEPGGLLEAFVNLAQAEDAERIRRRLNTIICELRGWKSMAEARTAEVQRIRAKLTDIDQYLLSLKKS